jgi:hypothetical protein
VLYHEFNKFHKERSLREVREPNLLRNIFPYAEVPKVDFDIAILPINPARNFLITDTTFRDGQQARPPFTVDQIATLFDYLHKLSGPRGIIRQSEFFVYTKKDREALDRCRSKGYQYPMITGWVRAQKKDLANVRAAGLTETGIPTSVRITISSSRWGWIAKKPWTNTWTWFEPHWKRGLFPDATLRT